MLVGTNGTLLTASAFAAELPQALLALAVMLPPTKTLLSIATVMTLVVEVPVIPAGSAQV